jgi:hypothetical protein
MSLVGHGRGKLKVFGFVCVALASMTCGSKRKGAFVAESALHKFDGDKPNSVPSTLLAKRWAMIIHLSRPAIA